MQQKYLHEHSLSNNLINNKTRQQMYLKHLREVQKINNRQAEQLKQKIKHHQSINQIHKKNKIKAFSFKLRQELKLIQKKNMKIFGKISSIHSDEAIVHGNRNQSKSISLSNSHSINGQKQKMQVHNQQEHSINKRYARQSFHYQYRKKRQQQIQIQNNKIMKAIMHQKSTILPLLRKNSARSTSVNVRQKQKANQKSHIKSSQLDNNKIN